MHESVSSFFIIFAVPNRTFMDLFSCLSQFVFCSFSSGSSGNCYYVGTTNEGVLVDMGVTMAKLETSLKRIDLTLSDIKALFITHNHDDHIKGLRPFLGKTYVSVYASPECVASLKEMFKEYSDRFVEMPVYQQLKVSQLELESFPVSHDAAGNVGYFIECQSKRLAIVTDCGILDDVVRSYLCRATSVVLEANYDKRMLIRGSYPQVLKQRIMSGNGHLSNAETIDFVADNYNRPYDNIMFCHLSAHNNKPELLMRQFYFALRQRHIPLNRNVTVFPLSRSKQSLLVYL